MGRHSPVAIASYDDARTLTPDDIMDGREAEGPVVILDDDGYYMASVLAELLAARGHDVTYVATEGMAAPFTVYTSEQPRVQAALLKAGVKVVASHMVTGLVPGGAELSCIYTGKTRQVACGSFVPVTSRAGIDGLWRALKEAPLKSLQRIGDCKAPGLIAHAVYDGHRAGQEFGEPEVMELRERVVVE